MTFFVYRILISLYALLDPIICIFDIKSKKRTQGLKNWHHKLNSVLAKNNKKLIWIHAASLGEFEQGRPIIDALSEKDYFILLSFYSPSGYEIRQDYAKADSVVYLPIDTFKNAKSFINLTKPHVAIFIKYEYWWNYLKYLTDDKVPTYFISTIFRQNQYFFQWPFKSFRRILQNISCFYVQDQKSVAIANKYSLKAILAGDTRLDNVIARAEKVKAKNRMLIHFKTKKRTIIYGSIWLSDIKILADFINNDEKYNHIIVPHDISEENIIAISAHISKDVTLYTKSNKVDSAIVIIDKIGVLFDLYNESDIAYIGGGFSKGIHNILEPLAYLKPVLFGPNYNKFNEAKDAIEFNFGFSISNYTDFKSNISLVDTKQKEIEGRINEWVVNNAGAKNKILNSIQL